MLKKISTHKYTIKQLTIVNQNCFKINKMNFINDYQNTI